MPSLVTQAQDAASARIRGPARAEGGDTIDDHVFNTDRQLAWRLPRATLCDPSRVEDCDVSPCPLAQNAAIYEAHPLSWQPGQVSNRLMEWKRAALPDDAPQEPRRPRIGAVENGVPQDAVGAQRCGVGGDGAEGMLVEARYVIFGVHL